MSSLTRSARSGNVTDLPPFSSSACFSFDLEALHKAVARIEHAQGWLPEPRARYQINERGEAVRTPRTQDEPRRPAQDKCDREAHTGYRSAERIAIEQAAPIIANATSWKELHAALAARGMRYERTGSGAKVFVGETAVKASRVARNASLGKLEKRLGVYREADNEVRVKPPQAQPLRPEMPGWHQYNEQREKYYAERREAWKALCAQHDRERQDLHNGQRKRRAEVLAGNFTGRGQVLNTLRAALAEEQRSESQAQREHHARARERLREHYGRFPGIEQWLRRQGDETRAEQWRYREHAAPSVERRVPPVMQVSSAMYTRFVAESKDRQNQRRLAVERLWSEYGRDVARLKNASKQRWAVVKLVAKGPIAGKLWALSARAADQRAWRQLHERHRAALRVADEQNRPLEWGAWIKAIEAKAPPTDMKAPHGARVLVATSRALTPHDGGRRGRKR